MIPMEDESTKSRREILEKAQKSGELALLAGVIDPRTEVWEPFDERAMTFLDALSRSIRKSSLREIPDVAALAFWCRRPHLEQLKKKHDSGKEVIRLGRGELFHAAPSNVPMMFAYSFAIGLLAGCTNIVRISGRSAESVRQLCKLIEELMKEDDFAPVRERSSFVSYGHSETLNAYYLANCDGRVIWGGDATVLKMRTYPGKPQSFETVFPDRWSFALVSEKEWAQAGEGMKQAWVHRFYNDTYVMDQNGCSSPQLVVWLCDPDSPDEAREQFWTLLAKEAAQSYEIDAYKAARKYERTVLAAMGEDEETAEGAEFPAITGIRRYLGNYLTVARIDAIGPEAVNLKGGFGLFYEAMAGTQEDVLRLLTPKVQTITCIGVDRQELALCIAKGHGSGADRIVEAGQALDMDTIWDGRDLIETFSRRIEI